MASYPNAIRHRPSRRRAGRGQGPFPPAITATATPSASTVVINFNVPVAVSGPLPLTVATLTYVSQVINSPTQVTVTMNGTVATHAWSLAGGPGTVSTYIGGILAGASGTFP